MDAKATPVDQGVFKVLLDDGSVSRNELRWESKERKFGAELAQTTQKEEIKFVDMKQDGGCREDDAAEVLNAT